MDDLWGIILLIVLCVVAGIIISLDDRGDTDL